MASQLFSANLQQKIDQLKALNTPISLGALKFTSPFLLAPMSAISTAPFRLLMQELGAGGAVSELISCHGINHGNEKTLQMLKLGEGEENTGLQLFGEDGRAMALAAQRAADYGPKFIDINMGCPVRKVVTKGGGSALLKEPAKLGAFFATIKKAITIPLTIKIRTGWDRSSLNAAEIIKVAHNEGIEYVAIHGRTRCQQYTGLADWDFLEKIAESSSLPIVGNGDLHSEYMAYKRWQTTSCQGLMLGRGALRDPFIFLKSMRPVNSIHFSPSDYLEVIAAYFTLLRRVPTRERVLLVQMRKHITWPAAGFPAAAKFKASIFAAKSLDEVLKLTELYFQGLAPDTNKQINLEKSFMAGGHG